MRGGGPEGDTGMSEQRTVWWEDGRVRMIDQTRLPAEELYLDLATVEQVAEAITSMRVRGAPAIGVTAALGMALAAREAAAQSPERFRERVRQAAGRLRQTRPTAVNLFWAIDRLLLIAEGESEPSRAAARMVVEAGAMVEEGIRLKQAMGAHGARLLPERGGVL